MLHVNMANKIVKSGYLKKKTMYVINTNYGVSCL